MKKIFFLFLISFFITSCQEPKKVSLYQEAMNNLKIGNYYIAGEKFEQIEDLEPFTQDATNGLIMASYSYYKSKNYEDSIRVIDYFIQSNPINKNIDYLLYLKGLNYYDRIKSPSKARDLIESADYTFKELLYKYPNSVYTKDVKERIKNIETYMSGNEMSIANFYLKRKNYIGAINHYTNILNNFPNSKYVPETLYRLMEINNILGMKFESIQYYELLIKNFPTNTWTKQSIKIIKSYEKK